MIANIRVENLAVCSACSDVSQREADPQIQRVEATIEAASVNTREPQRDEHLRSADFFDVANFPTLSFRSKRAESLGGDNLKLTGDLTIRGVTREVSFDVEGPTAPVKDPYGNVRVNELLRRKIGRKDFGLFLTHCLKPAVRMIGDEIKITIEAELIQQAAAA